MSAVILQDEIVHYEVLGRGRPLVFLHGWVGSWRYWIPAMQAASVAFRAYAIDLWGFGDTAKNPMYYSVEQQLNLLDQFLLKMGIGKIALVGHGLGAAVALLFATRQPRLVDRVMGICLPNGENKLNSRMYNAAPPELVDWLLSPSPVSEAARVEAPKADPKVVQLSLASLQNVDTNALLARLTTPCVMVYGQNDPAVTLPLHDPLNGLPEHLHQVVFDQSGHFPMLDEPSKFNRLMADFLALASGDSPRKLQLKEEWKRRVR